VAEAVEEAELALILDLVALVEEALVDLKMFKQNQEQQTLVVVVVETAEAQPLLVVMVDQVLSSFATQTLLELH
jgi:hypothetical protein